MADGTEDVFDYLSTVKILLGIDGDEKDSILSVFLDMTRASILNYCNISELPSALNYTLCQMCADTYRDITASNTSGEVAGKVSSISEDGRSVSFSSGAEFKAGIEDRITRTTELVRFKRLYKLD